MIYCTNMVRRTITIPNEFLEQVKASLGKKGFNTLNEYLLDLIRRDMHQYGATEINKSEQPHHIGASPSTTLSASPKRECPICYEMVSADETVRHYQQRHGDI